MDKFEVIYNRILEITQTKTQTDLAKIFSTSQPGISDAIKRKSIPPAWILKLYDLYNVSPEWINSGKEPKYITNNGFELESKSMPEFSLSNKENIDKTVIYSSNYSYSSYKKSKLQMIDYITLPVTFIKKNCLVFKLENRSMEPVLHFGAILGVDTTQLKLQSGEIFAFFIEGEGLKFKRIIYDGLEDNYLLAAENQSSYNIVYNPTSKSISIIGKLVWILQEL